MQLVKYELLTTGIMYNDFRLLLVDTECRKTKNLSSKLKPL